VTRPLFHPAGTPSGGGGGTPKAKLLLALGLLVAAGVVVAWQLGLFGGGASPSKLPPLTPEEQVERDEAVRLTKERTRELEEKVQQGENRGPG
jgi:hypothetical protein